MSVTGQRVKSPQPGNPNKKGALIGFFVIFKRNKLKQSSVARSHIEPVNAVIPSPPPSIISLALSSKEARDGLLAARGDSALRFLDNMLQMLDTYGDDDPEKYCPRIRHLLIKLSQASALLPSTLLLKDVEDRSPDPVHTDVAILTSFQPVISAPKLP